jgi:hypothetical protein
MPETSGELPSAQDVRAATAAQQDATAQTKATRLGVRIALGAIAFAVLSNSLTWVHGARATEAAKKAAVVEAARAREEADRGLCEVLGFIIDADTPSRTPAFRAALERAYEAPGCVPPIEQRPKPTPLPSG